MDWIWLVGAVLLAALVLAGLAWRPLRCFGREVQVERARELFRLQRERIEGQFLTAAQATGKPRGLRWMECQLEVTLELARDRQTGQIVGLVPATIRFEAIEGSDMEGHDAVANLRAASAVFFFERGQWRSAGKAVFNMGPDEALRHFKNQYERITAGP